MSIFDFVSSRTAAMQPLLFRLLASCIVGLSLIFLYGLTSSWNLNADIKIDMVIQDPVRIKAYYNTGYGYHEQESVLKGSVFGVGYLSLPKSQLIGLRLDIESNIEELVIRSICFTSMFAAHCWQGPLLQNSLRPTNNVRIEPDGQLVKGVITGPDPYVELIGDIGAAQHNVSTLSLKRMLAVAFVISALIFLVWCLLAGTQVGRRIWPSRLAYFKAGMPVPVGSLLAMFLLFAIVFCGYWSGLYELWGGRGYLLLFTIVLALSYSFRETRLALLGVVNFRNFTARSNADKFRALLCTGFICIPVLYFLVATWNQEFPHLGDHEYHYWANTVAYSEIMANSGLYRSFLFLFLAAIITGYTRLGICIAVAVLFYFDVGAEMHGIFSRYPAGARLLAFPFLHLSTVQAWESPLNAGRLANSLAVPIWLLVLRPLLLGRWPGWLILPVGLLVFYQAETVYLFTTAYIDPWAAIAVLLAAELLLRAEQQSDYLKACLVLGVGAVIKEQLVFIIPWVWMAGKPWLRDNGQKLLAIIIGACSVLPFLLYYFVRRSSGFSRYDYVGIEQIFSGQWQAEFWHRVVYHFGEIGLVMLVLLALFWVFILVNKNTKPYRFSLLMLFGALVSLILLFNLDVGGMAFTGYPRFYLPILVLLAAPLFLLDRITIQTNTNKRILFVACVIILVGNLPALSSLLVKTQGPDAARNFSEHYDAPIYLPITTLIKAATLDGGLQAGQAVYIRHVTGGNQPAFVYPHLLRSHPVEMLHELACNCNHGGATLLPYVYPAGLHKDEDLYDPSSPGYPLLPKALPPRWSEVNDGKAACLMELKRTCSYYTEQKIGDFVTGAIGVY